MADEPQSRARAPVDAGAGARRAAGERADGPSTRRRGTLDHGQHQPGAGPGDDKPWAVAVSCADIAERNKAEDALRRSEAMRDTAERVGRNGRYRWDLATRRVAWSPGMFALFDVDPEGFDGDVVPVLEARVRADDQERVLHIGETVAVGGDA